mgnify:CR=1 FL=1
MSEIILTRDVRLSLRAQAHHLDPVVLLGANGLTEAVMKEIDRELKAHELIKVRVPTDDREEREAIYSQVADTLGAARVQMIGKLLIFWRPAEDETEEEASARIMQRRPLRRVPRKQPRRRLRPRQKRKLLRKSPAKRSSAKRKRRGALARSDHPQNQESHACR